MAKPIHIYFAAVCMIMVSGGAMAEPLNEANTQQLKKELNAKWTSLRTEVKTAAIRYRLFRRSTTPMSRRDFNALLDGLNIPENPDGMRELIKRVDAEPIRDDHLWTMMEFYKDGIRLRENMGDDGGVQVVDGDMKIVYNPANRHAILYAPGASKRYQATLNDFRYVPPLEAQGVKVVSRTDSSVILSVAAGQIQLEVELATGCMRRRVMSDREGNIIDERRELGRTENDAGIHVPRVIANASYSGEGMLQSLDLIYIEDARFNQPLKDGVFKIQTTTKINVHDRRDPGGHRRSIIGLPPTDDLKRAAAPEFADDPEASTSVWLLIAATVIALALFVGAYFLMKRRPPTRNTTTLR